MKRTAAPLQREVGKLELKWSRELIEAGWLGLPSVFLQRQQAFRLDSLDLNILLQIADHWWNPNDLPFPSKRRLAERIGVTQRTIQRHLAEMEKDGLIRRNARHHSSGGNKTNSYSFQGLLAAAVPFAEEILSERLRRKREKSARDKRKRPNLHLVRE